MVDKNTLKRIIEPLLAKIETKDQEIGRLLIYEESINLNSEINLWAIRKNIRDLKEISINDLELDPNIEVKITYAPPNFFQDVLEGKNTPYWQVATVIRLLRSCDIVFDPYNKMQEWVNMAPNISWDPEVIELKRQTAQMLLKRVRNRINDDMLADAYIWLIKAAEEAICVPLMKNNAFDIGTPALMFEALNELNKEIYNFLSKLLQIQAFSIEKVETARQELERLADYLYQKNINTDREMWILAAFVSMNESEKRLKQSIIAREKKLNDQIIQKLFHAAIGELWQAYFLVAQQPRLEVKLDPWVVGSFWNHFGSSEITEKWFIEQEEKVMEIIKN